MKRSRGGFSFTEVMIASVILMVVIIIVYAVFDTSDKAYWTQVPVKEAQINVQKVLESVSYETHESGLDFVWGAPITGETLPAGVQQSMVWASARDANNTFITNASFQPTWQKTLALVPLNLADGTVALFRFTFATTPPASPTCTPRINVQSGPGTLSLSWLDSGGVVISTSATVARTSGVKQLPNLNLFSITPVTNVVDAQGTTVVVDLIQVKAQVVASAPQGKVNVMAQTSIRGRN